MTRKSVGYVELVWSCPRCGTKNPGPQKFCNGCGGPQPENVQFEQPAEEKLLKEGAAVARAQAGPDVHCPYCGTRNSAGAKFCGGCGGDLAGAKARERGRVLGAHRAGPAPKVKCPACGTENPADAARCSNCSSPLPTTPSAAPAAAPSGARAGAALRLSPVVLGIGAACLILGALGLWLLFGRSTAVEASVTGVQWERSVQVEAFGPVEREDWRDDVPAGAQIGSCRLEYSNTQDNPAPVATEVCGTPYTVDQGSGYGEVVQDCEYRVYEDRCTYTLEDWSVIDTVTAQGSSLDPSWPTANLSASQRFGEQTETYAVQLAGDGRTYTYRPDAESQFLQFEIGSRWLLEVNALGGIRSIEPAS